MKIAIFGIGRVGLPLALSFADQKQEVIGVDINEIHVRKIREGKMPFIEDGAELILHKCVNKNFHPTTDSYSAIAESEVLILTLGTPVDEHMNPVFSDIESVIDKMIPNLKKNQLIILRSTVSPGTTEYLKRYIEARSELRIGKDLFLAFCPERIAEGKAIEEIRALPQIVGALDENSKKKAEEVFKILTKDILLTDARSAELAKLYSNMYRYINFAIANEFMMIAHAHDRDIYEISKLVNKNYKRGGLAQPGLAAGPCLYKDGFFLVNKTPYTELISTSWKINETTPGYLISEIRKIKQLEKANVLILGLSFKADIDDTRNSLSFKAKKVFHEFGSNVMLHDPYIEKSDIHDLAKKADVIFVAINHREYKNLGKDFLVNLKKDCVVCDIWNVFGTEKIIFKAGEIK